MEKTKKIDFFIEVTSDWATVTFMGANLIKTEIAEVEGIVKQVNIQGNKILMTPFVSRKGVDGYLKLKFHSLIENNDKIESIIIEKGDKGIVDVEIDGRHFVNLSNIPDDPSNTMKIEINIVPQKSKSKGEIKVKRKEIKEYPTILIVTPTKDDAHYLPRHLKAWEEIDYPRERLRWVWIYGKSKDDTKKILDEYFSNGEWNCEIYSELPFKNLIPNSAMWIGDIMNSARELYKGEDFVILDDSDIVGICPTLLKELVSLDLDIVAPYVWHDGRIDDFFDTYVFRDLNGVKYPHHGVPHMNEKNPIELSSAGTMLLIKGKIFKTTEFDNPCPTLQFCKNAKKQGYRIWAAPWVKIFHADVAREKGESHMSPEYYVERGLLPKSILNKVK